MASIRSRIRRDGTPTWAVLYSLEGRQTSLTFIEESAAEKFRTLVNTIGPQRAMDAWGVADTPRASAAADPTVAAWVQRYIDSRTGVVKSTLYDYRAYLANDIKPVLGDIPLGVLSREDVAGWVQGLADTGSSGKTIQNKHGFLSAALNAAVVAGAMVANPAAGTRLPRTERAEMVFLTHPEFQQLRLGFTERWYPLVDFLVVSGARFGEVAALRPADVDRNAGTVHIARTWKRTYEAGGYELGPTKTKKSVRTINVDAVVLEALDYSREFLFTNTKGGPIRLPGWRSNVWYPSVARARKEGLAKAPRVHDMRHTCASWMMAGGVPLPLIQSHLGHESITTTVNQYGHLDRKDAAAAAALMAAALRPDVA
ncbi:MAG: tyrosine-type recombinase/integrase [Mycobacterium sp.]